MAEKPRISQFLEGRDEYGPWKEFSVKGVVQRMRWIEPGSFLMGSPEDESGRVVLDEGPWHDVRIEKGFWLFDTPCTQALWEAVMGENPSEFKSPERPVELVSWKRVQEFLRRLNEHIPGLDLVLPSEAQWEYACRAGTDTASYNGPIEILGDANAPELDTIAWYGGNSGVDFELRNGQERTWLRYLQHPRGKAGTHPVKHKLPNVWGLYDMLGNVWEWTQDTWHDGYYGAPVDETAWVSADDDRDALHVLRGGSWDSEARYCRCACRIWGPSRNSSYNVGFRCAAKGGDFSLPG